MAGHGNYAVILRCKAALPLRTFPDKKFKNHAVLQKRKLAGRIHRDPTDGSAAQARSARRKPKVAGVSLGKTPLQGEPGLTFSPIGH